MTRERASDSPLRFVDVAVLTSAPPPQGQAELLKHARSEVLENVKQIHYAALTCKLSKGGQPVGSDSKSRPSLEAIPEKATAEDELTDEDN